MQQFTFTTHQTLAGCMAGRLAQIPPRLRFPIPSQQLQPAERRPKCPPSRSELGTKQLSQYFWLRRGRRLQIAIFNMLLQPDGGGRRY